MVILYVFEKQSGISGAGKPYHYQTVQIVQTPFNPDELTRHFLRDESDALPPGKYTADVYFRKNRDKVLQPNFRNFVKID